MKKKKSLLICGVLILIGVGCIYLMCLRAEQIDKEVEREEVIETISNFIN